MGNGKSFFFKVNDVEVFAKGTNMIPIDEFSTSVTEERQDWMIKSALLANMNMIRVWGGGRYLPDSFYAKADSLGIMIW